VLEWLAVLLVLEWLFVVALLVCYHFIYYLTAITYQSYYRIWMFVITLLVCYRFRFSRPHFIIVD
jgi:hypothetical protein